jgi:hypothetical protein
LEVSYPSAWGLSLTLTYFLPTLYSITTRFFGNLDVLDAIIKNLISFEWNKSMVHGFLLHPYVGLLLTLFPFLIALSPFSHHTFSFPQPKSLSNHWLIFAFELSSLGSLTSVEDPRGVSLASQAI